MGIYNRRFGDRDCQIRITKRGNVYDVSAHIVRVGEVLPETTDDIPVLPNEHTALEGMINWLSKEYGPELKQ